MIDRGSGKIRVAILDDHPLLREGVKKMMQSGGDAEIVVEAENVQELLSQIARTDLHLVILDISLPGRSGLDALAEIKRVHPKVPVLVLSMHPEERFAVRALRAGAAGYVTKASAADELLSAVRKVASGRVFVSAAVAELLAERLSEADGKAPHEHLSEREMQVFTMIAKGTPTKRIAADTRLSVNTVNTYRSRILAKLGMRSNAELIRYAVENKLLE